MRTQRTHHPAAGWSWSRARAVCLEEARRVLGSSALAEDAAQEAVVRAWTHRDACRTPARPASWLRSIARREALRLLARDRELPVDEVPELVAAGGGEDDAALRLDVRRALRDASDDDRALLVGRYWEDLDDGELAGRLGIAEVTVRVRLHRVRRRLRERLEAPAEGGGGPARGRPGPYPGPRG